MKRFNDFLTLVDTSVLYRFIIENGVHKSYHRGDSLCLQDDPCPVIAIVESGYFQYSVINSKGDNCITGFAFENEIVTDFIGSFLLRQGAFTSIYAGCNVTVTQVKITDARQFMTTAVPDYINHISPILLAEAYRRYIDLHVKTPKERYIELSTRCQGDLSMIPLQELASYLSISRRQLQRIRESLL